MFSRYRLFLLASSSSCMAALWLLLHKTAFGRVVRAGVQNPDMVAALGIWLQPYMTAIVVLGVGHRRRSAACCSAPITIVHPAMGTEIMTVAFVVVVIGGLGCFWGVVLAALLVGVVRGITIDFAAGGRRGLDVRADVPGADVPPARPARRAHRAVRVSMRMIRTASQAPAAVDRRRRRCVALPIAAAGHRPDAVTSATEVVDPRDRRAWRSTCWSAPPASSPSATAPGSASAATPPALVAAALVPGPDRAAAAVRGRLHGAAVAGRRLPDPAPARRVLLAADAGAVRR